MDKLDDLPVDPMDDMDIEDEPYIDKYFDPYVEEPASFTLFMLVKVLIVVGLTSYLTNNPIFRSLVSRIAGDTFDAHRRSQVGNIVQLVLVASILGMGMRFNLI